MSLVITLISFQVCCKDLWQLEVEKPSPPGRVQLVKASTNALEVCWNSVPTAEGYLLQIQKYDIPITAGKLEPIPYAQARSTPSTPSASSIPSPQMSTPTNLTPILKKPNTEPRVTTSRTVGTPNVSYAPLASVKRFSSPGSGVIFSQDGKPIVVSHNVMSSALTGSSPANLPSASSLVQQPANRATTASNVVLQARAAAPRTPRGGNCLFIMSIQYFSIICHKFKIQLIEYVTITYLNLVFKGIVRFRTPIQVAGTVRTPPPSLLKTASSLLPQVSQQQMAPPKFGGMQVRLITP